MRTIGVVIVMSWGLVACDKMKQSKASEAQLQLDHIGSFAKRMAVQGGFPVGSVGPTPSAPCCTFPDKRCQPQPTDWQDPIWRQLDFALIDRPFAFQYSYQGTATEFTATAVGDPECTGSTQTYVAHGTVVNGEPTFTVETK
jgi:hypothetical protein